MEFLFLLFEIGMKNTHIVFNDSVVFVATMPTIVKEFFLVSVCRHSNIIHVVAYGTKSHGEFIFVEGLNLLHIQ